MRTCWKCGDSEIEREIVICEDHADEECNACNRECSEKRDREEDMDPDDFVIEEGGPRPLERDAQ